VSQRELADWPKMTCETPSRFAKSISASATFAPFNLTTFGDATYRKQVTTGFQPDLTYPFSYPDTQ